MPVQYNPTDSRFLTVAQSRTNNGQKDIRIILDIPTNDFYSLDDDGNFIIIGGTDNQTLEQVLTAGSSTGGLPITSPDTNTFIEIADSFLISKVLNLANTTQLSMYTNQCDLTVNDSASGDYSNINMKDAEIKIKVATSGGNQYSYINTGNAALTMFHNRVGVQSIIVLDEFVASMIFNDTLNIIQSGIVSDNDKNDLFYIDTPNAIDNVISVNKDGYSIKNLPAYENDADAAADGLTTGFLYQTDGTGTAPLNVAGIVMIKQ